MTSIWSLVRTLTLALVATALVGGGMMTLGCDDEPSDGDGDADSDGDADGDGDDEILSVTILQTSDIHNRATGYGPQAEYTPLDTSDDDPVLGGFARLAALIADIRAEQAAAGVPVLVVDSGDYFMGTVYDATAADPVVLRYFNAAGYDAITLGNHEFDWGPAGLAMLISNALGATPAFAVPIVASNAVTSADDAGDDDLEALFGAGVIQDRLVVTLDNGLRVGILGFLGVNADEDAPTAEPVTFEHGARFLQAAVDDIRATDQVHMVLALSHSGIDDDLAGGEDVGLAQGLEGVDVVASGHSHLATTEPIVEGDTVVFQPGEYGEWLSRIDLSFNVTQGRIEDFTFELVPVNDEIEGDAQVQGVIDAANVAINSVLEGLLGLSTYSAVVELGFELDRMPMAESGLGSLCADATRAAATWAVMGSADPTPFAFAVVPNGVIRDDLHASAGGEVTFSDVYNVLPLGLSPDPANQGFPGWPLISAYLTAGELRNVCEVPASLAGMVGDSAYLNISGIRCEYDPDGAMMATVDRLLQCGDAVLAEAGGDEDLFSLQCEDEMDLEDTDTLYRIVTDLYTLLMMDLVADFMPIVPKHADGTPFDLEDMSDILSERIDFDADTDGVQELKNWATLVQFLAALPDAGGDPDLPDLPEAVYGSGGSALGRVQVGE